MKILHVANNDNGGAANAMLTLHNSLIKNKINSKVLVLHKYKDDENIIPILENRNVVDKVIDSINYRMFNLKRIWHKKIFKSNNNFTYYSGPYDITKHKLYKSADVIHLHWYHNFVNIPALFKKSNKPIVYTLHDENLFLGGYHYSFDKQIANKESWKLDKIFHSDKTAIFKAYFNINFVAPSKWLFELLTKNDYRNSFFIPYGVKFWSRKNINTMNTNTNLYIKSYKTTFLLIADNINSPRKGIEQTINAFLRENNDNYLLLIVGNGSQNYFNENIKYLGYINDRDILYEIYSAVDIFINPALADNLPNTVLEALSCGTPVIGFNCGGIRDMINGKNGILFEIGDFDSLFKPDNNEFILGLDRNEIRKSVLRKYDVETQRISYQSLYDKINK